MSGRGRHEGGSPRLVPERFREMARRPRLHSKAAKGGIESAHFARFIIGCQAALGCAPTTERGSVTRSNPRQPAGPLNGSTPPPAIESAAGHRPAFRFEIASPHQP